MTAIEQLQVTMVELAKKFQAGEISLDDFMEDQARLSESIAKAKLDETRAMAHAVKAAKEAEAGARELVATEAAIVLEGCDPFFEATAVITVTPGDNRFVIWVARLIYVTMSLRTSKLSWTVRVTMT